MSGTKIGGLTSGNNGHNGRCGQLFPLFVDIMDKITLCGHYGHIDILTSNQLVARSSRAGDAYSYSIYLVTSYIGAYRTR